MRLFGPLYERVIEWSRHPHAERYLGAMSFAESSFFPIPVDVMLAPMVLANREKWIRYASIATLFSVLGGLAGYWIGYALFDLIEPWLRDSHYWADYETSRRWFDEYGIWVVFIAGFSPLAGSSGPVDRNWRTTCKSTSSVLAGRWWSSLPLSLPG